MSSPNPEPTSSPSPLYPSVNMKDLAENLFPEDDAVSTPPKSSEELLVKIPGAIVHLIERENSIELASGEFSILSLRQDNNIVAVIARVRDEIQWPLAKDEPAVKLDDSHYFFNLRVPEMLNYGLTIASKGHEDQLKKLDQILETYSCFSVQKVKEFGKWEVLDCSISEETSAAYWTTLAPNVDDYSAKAARLIAAGSGELIKGILWCGDVTVDRLKWGNEFLKKKMGPRSDAQISAAAMNSLKSVKKLTKMTEKVATGILTGVVKVSGFFTNSVVNSKVGKKFFSLLPGEIVLASLDGFNKVCDAVEVAGKNVMSTTAVVTTGLVSDRYGEQAGRATNEGLGAAGHAIGACLGRVEDKKGP